MVSSKYGARLSETDVQQLEQASQQLVVAATTIREMGPKWGEAVVNLLIAANLVIERLRDKGARAFAGYLERRGLHKPQDAAEATSAVEQERDALIAVVKEEER